VSIERVIVPSTGKVRYLARFSYIDDAGERQHRKRRFDRKKEAEAWLAQQRADRTRGVIWEPSRESLGSLIDRWVAQLGPPRSPSTIAAYRIAARRRFDAGTRAIPLAEVTPAVCLRIIARWQGQRLSGETMAHGYAVLRGALELARAERGVLANPLEDIDRPSRGMKAIVTWTPAQVTHFLRITEGDPFGFAWELLFATLIRIGELASLQWRDIDWAAGTLRILRTWSRDEDGRPVITGTTKTTASARVIPVPPTVVSRLAREQATRTSDDGGWVVQRHGQPLSVKALTQYWRKAVDASGLPRMTPHGARHTGATNMIAAGVPVAIVQRILGHTNPAFTLRRYVHPDQASLDTAMGTLDGLYRGETTIAGAQKAPKVVPMIKKARSTGT
jgi:integrase